MLTASYILMLESKSTSCLINNLKQVNATCFSDLVIIGQHSDYDKESHARCCLSLSFVTIVS